MAQEEQTSRGIEMIHVGWQRRVLLREGYWSEWDQYYDIYEEGRPEMVGRFRVEYRKIYAEE